MYAARQPHSPAVACYRASSSDTSPNIQCRVQRAGRVPALLQQRGAHAAAHYRLILCAGAYRCGLPQNYLLPAVGTDRVARCPATAAALPCPARCPATAVTLPTRSPAHNGTLFRAAGVASIVVYEMTTFQARHAERKRQKAARRQFTQRWLAVKSSASMHAPSDVGGGGLRRRRGGGEVAEPSGKPAGGVHAVCCILRAALGCCGCFWPGQGHPGGPPPLEPFVLAIGLLVLPLLLLLLLLQAPQGPVLCMASSCSRGMAAGCT